MLAFMHMHTIALVYSYPSPTCTLTHSHTCTLILHRLRLLLQQLDQGELPNILEMKKTVSYAADVLLGLVPRPITEEDDE